MLPVETPSQREERLAREKRLVEGERETEERVTRTAKVARSLNIPETEAQAVIAPYFGMAPSAQAREMMAQPPSAADRIEDDAIIQARPQETLDIFAFPERQSDVDKAPWARGRSIYADIVDEYVALNPERFRKTPEDQVSILDDARRNLSIEQAIKANPDEEARIRDIAGKLQMPPAMVRAIGLAEAANRLTRQQAKQVGRDAPATLRLLTDQDRAKIAIDDFNALSGVERTLRELFVSNEITANQTAINKLSRKMTDGVALRPSEMFEYERLKARNDILQRQRQMTDNGVTWFTNTIAEGATDFALGLPEMATYGAAGAVVGLLGGPGGAAQGFRIGAGVGQFTYNFDQIIGHSFEEYKNFRDDLGRLIDQDAARGAAYVNAVLSVGLEVAGERALMKTVPGLDKLVGGKDVVKSLLRTQAGRNVMLRIGKKVATGAIIEGVTEGLQQLTQIYTGEVLKIVAPGEFAPIAPEEVVSQTLQAAAAGAVGTLGITVPGATAQVLIENRELRKADKELTTSEGTVNRIEAAIAAAADTKLVNRDRGELERFINDAAADSPVSTIYLSAEDLATVATKAGLEPIQLAQQLGVSDQIQTAATTGSLLEMPIGKFIATVANTDLATPLTQVIKTNPFLLNRVEQEAYASTGRADIIAEADRLVQEAVTDETFAAEAQSIQDEVLQQFRAIEGGEVFTPEVSRAYSTITTQGYVSLARRMGISPREAYQKYQGGPLRIQREAGAAEGMGQPVIEQAQSQGYTGQDIGEAQEWVRAREKGLDMSQPARLERARAMGFDTERVLYHGTTADFKAFDVSASSQAAAFGPGVYLSVDPTDAGRWAKTKEGASVIPVYIKRSNVLTMEPLSKENAARLSVYLGRQVNEGDPVPYISLERRAGSVSEGARAAGFVGVEHAGPSGTRHVVIADPSSIRSVNAAFDPDFAESANILAQAKKQGYTGQDIGEATEWVRARAKGLDMSQPARMERAKAMGFDTETVLYHGTTENITSFDLGLGGKNTGAKSAKSAIWLSNNPEASDLYTVSDVNDLLEAGGFINEQAYMSLPRDEYKKFIAEKNIVTKGQAASAKLQATAKSEGGSSLSSAVNTAMETAVRRRDGNKYINEWIDYNDQSAELADAMKTALPDMRAAFLYDYKLRWAQSKGAGAIGDEVWGAQEFGAGPNILPVYVRLKNPLIVDQALSKTRPEKFSELIARAKENGHDGLIVRNTFDPLEMDAVAVFNPANIRSVNAAFDPDFAESANILAQAQMVPGADVLRVPAEPTSAAGAIGLSDDQVRAWYEANVDVSVRGIFTTLKYRTTPDLKNTNILTDLEPGPLITLKDGTQLQTVENRTIYRGRYIREETAVRDKPTKKQQKIAAAMARNMFLAMRGYILSNPSDTRTIFFGGASPAHKKVYSAALRRITLGDRVNLTYRDWFVIATRADAERLFADPDIGPELKVLNDGRSATGAAAAGTGPDGRRPAGPGGSDVGLGQPGGLGPEQSYGQEALAQTRRAEYRPDLNTIRLLPKADWSSYLHEMGHHFLEVYNNAALQIEQIPEADRTPDEQKIVDDMRILLTDMARQAGVTVDGDVLQWWANTPLEGRTPVHEKYAEATEKYFMEGKAPVPELQALFDRFKEWLIKVYQNLTALNVELTPEVRGVMDRMYAAHETVKTAEYNRRLVALFREKPETMTDQEWRAYQELGAQATSEAQDDLTARSLRDMQWASGAKARVLRDMQRDNAEKRKVVRAEVAAEVMARPVNVARSFFRRGIAPNGEPVTGPHKLNIDLLKARYPDVSGVDWKRLGYGQYGMLAKDGIDPDMAAEMLGYPSGEGMIRDLLAAGPAEPEIDAETDRRMLERFGDLTDEAKMSKAADEVIHSALRAKVLQAEYAALAKAARQTKPLVIAAREIAKEIVGRQLASKLNLNKYLAAERAAGRKAEAALRSGDFAAAASAKRDQLLNFEVVREAQRVLKERDKALDLFSRINKAKRETVSKTRNYDLVQAARAVLAAYGFGSVKNKPMDYMNAVKAYDPALYSALEPTILEAVTARKTLDQLTVAEFMGLRDVVRQFWDLSRAEMKVDIEGRQLDLEDIIQDLNGQLEAQGVAPKGPSTEAATDWQKRLRQFAGLKASMRRVETWARLFDRGKVGAFTKFIWRPVSEAADRYRTDRNTYILRFRELFRAIEPTMAGGKINAPEINYTFKNKSELLHAILHTGNGSNYRKLLLGRGWGSEDQDGNLIDNAWVNLINRLSQEGVLNKADFDFAQSVWDLLEEIKPLAQATHKKVFGNYFSEITAEAVQTPFGTYKGGYVPAVYDTYNVQDAALRAQQEAVEANDSTMFPSPASGFTKSRVEYNRELALDLMIMSSHIDKVLKFAHLASPVRDVLKILRNKSFSAMLESADPTAQSDMLLPWLTRAARQITEEPTKGQGGPMVDGFFRAIRQRSGMGLMFANMVNVAQQVTGFSVAALTVKPKYLASGMIRYMRDPIGLTRIIRQASMMMADRGDNQLAAMYGEIDKIIDKNDKYGQARDWFGRHTYFMQQGVQNVMDVIVWAGAYDQALAGGATETEAAKQGDAAVRQTQGTTFAEDVSRIETGPAVLRSFVHMYSYFNMWGNLLSTEMRTAVSELGLKKGAGRLMFVYMAGFAIPALLAQLIADGLRGQLPEDEDDDGWLDEWLSWFFGTQAKTTLAFAPIVGQAGNATIGAFTDVPYDDRVGGSPAISTIEASVRTPASVYEAIAEDGDKSRAVKDVLTLMTTLTGLPFQVLGRPIGYAVDVAEGDITPTSTEDYIRGLITGAASEASR